MLPAANSKCCSTDRWKESWQGLSTAIEIMSMTTSCMSTLTDVFLEGTLPAFVCDSDVNADVTERCRLMITEGNTKSVAIKLWYGWEQRMQFVRLERRPQKRWGSSAYTHAYANNWMTATTVVDYQIDWRRVLTCEFMWACGLQVVMMLSWEKPEDGDLLDRTWFEKEAYYFTRKYSLRRDVAFS